MINVGITGASGLIGWHLRGFLHGQPDMRVVPAGRPEFSSEDKLRAFVSACDVIVHLAGMNRGDEAEVAETNVALTRKLLAACTAAGRKPYIIFSSSTHIYRNTLYGNSKKKCSELLRSWADGNGAVFTNLVLPNVYGESGRPFYNSAVSTFCHQLAMGLKPEIINDSEVEILHARHVARETAAIIRKPVNGELSFHGTKMPVSRLLGKLQDISRSYSSHIIPDLNDETALDLFNTYRSYLFPAKVPVPLELKKDQRGYLFEAAKSGSGGQTFLSSTMPGITRGNHYHTRKFERFLVVKGRASIKLRRLFSGEVYEFVVDGERPVYVDMPALYTHNITNIGDSELLTLFYTNEIFNPADADTYQEKV